LAGSEKGTRPSQGYATVKYAPNGNHLWSCVTRLRPGSDVPAALALDNQGNVYVTGSSVGDGTSYDFATVKYVQGSQLASASLDLSSQFGFTLLGEVGRSYTIQASSNLANWTALTNFVSAPAPTNSPTPLRQTSIGDFTGR